MYLVGADFFIKGCIDIGGGGGLKNDQKREKIDKTHQNREISSVFGLISQSEDEIEG